MNKGISLLILGVLFCAMGLVFYSHLSSPDASSSSDAPIAENSSENIPQIPFDNATAPTVSAGQSAQMVTGEPAYQGRAEPATVAETQSDRASNTTQQRNEQVAPATRPDTGSAKTPASAEPPRLVPTETQVATAPTKNTSKEQSNKPETEAKKADKPAEKPAAELKDTGKLTPVENLAKDGNHTMEAIGLHFSGKKIYLRIEADSPFPFRTFFLPSPDRLVVDLPGKWKGIKAPTVPGNTLIETVRVGQQPSGPRIVLDMKSKPTYQVTRVSDTVLEIHFK